MYERIYRFNSNELESKRNIPNRFESFLPEGKV